MNALVFVPDTVAVLYAMCAVFGGGGIAVMLVGVVRIMLAERRAKRPASARPLQLVRDDRWARP